MAKTLYDILELSPSASREAIRAAYERLSTKFDPDLDEHRGLSDIRMRAEAIKEAFFTLGNPDARARYDRSLSSSSAVYAPSIPDLSPTWTMPKIILIVIALIAGGGWYLNNKHTEQKLATERAIAEARAKEAEAKAKAEAQAAEQERLALQRQRELDRQRNIQENRNRNDFERNRRQLDLDQRRQEMNERLTQDRKSREQQNLTQRSEMERQRQDAANVAEARRRADREKAELCRIERERYGKAISC